MKLRKEFITHSAGEESLLVPTGGAPFAGLVRGNRTLGVILELLGSEISEEQLIEAMCARFDAPRAVIAADVAAAIDKLRGIGALDE